MPIDREKALGADLGQSEGGYGPDDVILYHLGIGAGFRATDPGELTYTFEKNLKVLPSFAVVASSGMTARARPGPGRPGRAPQRARPLLQPGDAAARRAGGRDPPPAADLGRAHHARAGRGDLGQGQGRARRDRVRRERSRTARCSRTGCRCSCAARAASAARRDLRPATRAEPRARRRGRVADAAAAGAALPLNGDKNPLHADPEFAARGGFDKPILHGLCSFGIVCKAVVDDALGGDPTRVARYAARFAGVAFPGETLRTSWWRENGTLLIDVASAQRGAPIISNAAVALRG